jgi:4-carboxymuconolactone decarboxylase
MPEPRALDGVRADLVGVSAALATRDAGTIGAALTRAAALAAPDAVEEVLLQAHLFIGFPDALEAMILWREVSGATAPTPSPEEAELWGERGPAVCERVYAANYAKLRANVRSLHPDLDRWMVEGGYGRVIGRSGLDLATRELCIAALLVVWGAPRQLHSHLRGALNAGATPAEVAHAVEIACEYAAERDAAAARELWSGIAVRRGAATG